MTAVTTGLARQQWLELASEHLGERFASLGFTVPDNVRVGFGWPRGSHGRGPTIGQCWGASASTDKHNEVFISPSLGISASADDATRVTQSARIIDVLAHELAHAIVGVEAGHTAPFKRCALAVGLTGRMTATTAGAELAVWACNLVAKIGPFPTGGLNENGRKKQSTRLLKCVCPECGYTARITNKWIAEAGAPICPIDEVAFECSS